MDKEKYLQKIFESSIIFGLTEEDKDEITKIISKEDNIEKILKDIRKEIIKDKDKKKI